MLVLPFSVLVAAFNSGAVMGSRKGSPSFPTSPVLYLFDRLIILPSWNSTGGEINALSSMSSGRPIRYLQNAEM